MPGRWGAIMSGIGAGLAGGANTYMQHKELEQKQKIADATNELRVLVAQINGNTRLGVEDKRTERQQGRDRAKDEMLRLSLQNNIDLEGLKTDRAKTVQQMVNDGKIDVEDAKYWHQLDYKEIDKAIAAAHDEANKAIGAGHDKANVTVGAGHDRASVTVGAGHDTASNYRADMGYSSATDVANINQTGQNDRLATEMPLRIFRANQGRYPRGNAAARRAGSISQPTFGPSYADSMNAGALNPIGPTPPQFAPSANDMNMSPAPPKASMFPSRENIFQVPPPAMPPAPDDAGAPITAPAVAPKPTLSSSGFIGGAAPVRGGRSAMTAQRVEQQANDLMARITQLQANGRFDQARALKQQLADLVKQQEQ